MPTLEQDLLSMTKQANGDMLQYFADHPDKLAEKQKRDKSKKAVDEMAAMSMDLAPTVEASLAAMDEHAKLAAIDVSASRQIADTIIEQMGGYRRLQMMIGAKNFGFGPNYVSFRYPNKHKPSVSGNHLKVTLNGMDTYDLEFGYARGYNFKVVKKVNGLYADMLASTFTKTTGLHLRLASQQMDRMASKPPSTSGSGWSEKKNPHRWLWSDKDTNVNFTITEKPGVGDGFTFTLQALTDNGMFKHKSPSQWTKVVDAFKAANKQFKALAGESVSNDMRQNWSKAAMDEMAGCAKGESCDPTENMSEEDAKKWRLMNLQNKDKFTKGKAAAGKPQVGKRISVGGESVTIKKVVADNWIIGENGKGNLVLCSLNQHTKKWDGLNWFKGTEMAKAEAKAKSRMSKSAAGVNGFEEGARIPDGWDSGHIEDGKAQTPNEGSEVPDGSGNLGKRAAVDVAVGGQGQFRNRWPFVYAHGQAEEILGHDVVTFDKPAALGRFDARLIDNDGNPHPAVVFAWESRGMPAGLVVLKADRKGYADAVREVKKLSPKVASDKAAKTGLYGHTKRVQADCETSVRKVQKSAMSIARKVYAKNPKVAEFLSSHSSRAESLPAQILVAALGEMGPKVAAETKRAARLAELREQRGVTAATRSQKENAVAGKFPPDSKKGRGKSRTVMLTGDVAKVLGKSDYTNVKLSELSDGDLDKLYTKVTGKKAAVTPYEQNQQAMIQEVGNRLKRLYDPIQLAMEIVKLKSFKKMVGRSADMVKDALIALEDGGAVRRLDDDMFHDIRDEVMVLMGFSRRRTAGAAPRGKAQQAIASHIADWKTGQQADLTEISRHSSLRGVHFAKVMSAAEALQKSGLIDFDGVKVTKKAKLSDADAQTGEGIKQTADKKAGAGTAQIKSHAMVGDVIEFGKGQKGVIQKRTTIKPDGGVAVILLDSRNKETSTRQEVRWGDIKSLSHKGKKAADEKVARHHGLYGFGDKVASMGLNACSEVRADVGRIAYDLHRRRSSKHANITAFLDTHCKTAECKYSRLLAASYPSSDTKVAAIPEPRTVEAWLAFEG